MALALLLAAQTASPADALRILVVAPAGTAPVAPVEEIYAGLRAAGLQPVELDERAGVDRAPAPTVVRGVLDDARAHLLEAKARFHDLDLDLARSAADAAVDEVLRLDRPESALDVMIDALLLKANAALQAGNDNDAKASLLLVSRLDPARAELHPGLYPPSLCEAYAAVRAVESPPASLVVRARVAGFTTPEILVDGRPFSSNELGAGPHLVIVRASGAVPFARVINLDAVEDTVLAPFLAPPDAAQKRAALVAKIAAAVGDAARMRALTDLASLCAARAVLFVHGTTASLWSSRGLEPLPLPAAADGTALGQATLAALQAPVRRSAGLPLAAPEPDPTPLVVAGVAGLVVAAAAASLAVYALVPSSAPKKPPPRPVDVKGPVP